MALDWADVLVCSQKVSHPEIYRRVVSAVIGTLNLFPLLRTIIWCMMVFVCCPRVVVEEVKIT
jgi:hypothetical protein